MAEELGVTVTKDPGIGWSPTTLAAATVERRQEAEPAGVCSCGRWIRVAPSVLEAGPITCGVCGADFEPEDR